MRTDKKKSPQYFYLDPECIFIRSIRAIRITPEHGFLDGQLGLLQVPLLGSEVTDKTAVFSPSTMSLCLDDGFVDVGPEGVEGRGLGVCEGVGLLRGTAFMGWSESWLVISCSHRYRKVVNEKKNERVGSGE